ncbi:alpha/beta hydrolase [Acidisphaera sp. S103]|uniref:alpha/beta hydrolase n=1 Tax=Acidisphaera sp. S103 TaxID=1747223 RepID=UPI00131C1C4A|nr:alpha/beta hydrolase [Acidisphaera sp. S103]
MSWQNSALTWALRRWVKPDTSRGQDIAASRALTDRVPFRAKLVKGWRLRVENGAVFKGDWIEPEREDHAARRRCILYFHGGAYITMAARSYRTLTSRLAIWSDARLFALDYRLAPEYRFPAALDDAVAAYRALIEAGTPASRIVVAGDSAGGGLALALLVALRDAGDALPAGAVLFSPWTDLAATGQSLIDNDACDALIFGAWVHGVAVHYLGDTAATNPLASPLYADLTGLPAMLVQVSGTEVLLDDSRRVVEKARLAGVDATLRVWPGLPHVWQFFATILPEGRAALREAAAFVREALP